MDHIEDCPIEILVFKTNIRFKKDLKKVGLVLGKDTRVKDWHVDREDCDRVLRIEAQNLCVAEIIRMVALAGFCCEELLD
jgi:copper chaperone